MARPEWTFIMVHHSLTDDSGTVSWSAIRKYHKSLGWKDIGYHFGVEFVSNVHAGYEILKGRPLTMAGAHCKEADMNQLAIGACAVGNFDVREPAEAILVKLVELIKELQEIFSIPTQNIIGHRDYATYKSCPGKLFNLDVLRQRVG